MGHGHSHQGGKCPNDRQSFDPQARAKAAHRKKLAAQLRTALCCAACLAFLWVYGGAIDRYLDPPKDRGGGGNGGGGGSGGVELGGTARLRVNLKPFPEAWGAPPQMQTKDLRPFPGGYTDANGKTRGSGTVARWIAARMAEDAAKEDSGGGGGGGGGGDDDGGGGGGDAAAAETYEGGVRKTMLTAGDSATYPASGCHLTMHYTGTLASNGNQFDSSVGRQPFQFTLGQGHVIRGWDVAVAHMSLGESAQLDIPAAMGYGARGAGSAIPPNADLVFTVKLLKIDC